MRALPAVLFVGAVLLSACSSGTPLENTASPDLAVADLAAAVDLAPSCGRAIGAECCLASTTYFCSAGFMCDAQTLKCVPPPDLTTLDLAPAPRQPGTVCDAGTDCDLPDSGVAVQCKYLGNVGSQCCYQRHAGDAWHCS